ncbi:hypothetical protein DAERI_090065 [Deinococcus aerius]|uniref:Nudix hydrolase domain-containing protein n=1 Tax=Deinococcus aerius TaxID=200253 RepID=A0A2I9CWR3_9DEIO|nr:NUDIX pyrophosphatase [Deinococcus aerius]GBF06479.1 hypothetical protein DAERI_090065 [Deinococcus aerius]
MGRAPFQVLVLPFRLLSRGQVEFALLRRRDAGYWQGVAGGGEDDETPEQTARREATEEAGISPSCPLVALQAVASIPAVIFPAHLHWPKDLLVVPEYAFGVDATGQELVLSGEHDAIRWCAESQARQLVKWDSNRTALWELARRIESGRV